MKRKVRGKLERRLVAVKPENNKLRKDHDLGFGESGSERSKEESRTNFQLG